MARVGYITFRISHQMKNWSILLTRQGKSFPFLLYFLYIYVIMFFIWYLTSEIGMLVKKAQTSPVPGLPHWPSVWGVFATCAQVPECSWGVGGENGWESFGRAGRGGRWAVHTSLSHWTSFVKHKLKEKNMNNFNSKDPRALNPRQGPRLRGHLCVIPRPWRQLCLWCLY